jgi:hypothetical protein
MRCMPHIRFRIVLCELTHTQKTERVLSSGSRKSRNRMGIYIMKTLVVAFALVLTLLGGVIAVSAVTEKPAVAGCPQC